MGVIEIISSTAFKLSFQASRYGYLLLKYISLKKLSSPHEGYYHSAIYHGAKKTLHIADVVEVSATLFTLRIKPIWNHSGANNYEGHARFHPKFENFLLGTWQHNSVAERFGAFTFKISDANSSKKIIGVYSGASTKGTIQSSIWLLERTSTLKNIRQNGRLISTWRYIFEKHEKKPLLDDIINKHKGYFATRNRAPYIYDDMAFEIPVDGFNPQFGKISRPLLDTVLKFEGHRIKTIDVLDIGTGSGFYATVFAKQGAREVWGTDISQSVLEAARANAEKNNVSQVPTFILCDPEDMFSRLPIKKKFDVIIANLPFSDPRKINIKKRENIHYNFLGSDDVLFSFLIGSVMHLKKHGKIYMSFGKTGNDASFIRFCEVAGLTRKKIQTIKGTDDDFYIYEIVKSDIGLNFISDIADMPDYVKSELNLSAIQDASAHANEAMGQTQCNRFGPTA